MIARMLRSALPWCGLVLAGCFDTPESRCTRNADCPSGLLCTYATGRCEAPVADLSVPDLYTGDLRSPVPDLTGVPPNTPVWSKHFGTTAWRAALSASRRW